MHGDWHISTRLYGSRAARRCSARSATALAGFAVATPTPTAPSRRSPPRCCEAEGASRAGVFTTYSDLGAFSGPVVPVPEAPRVIFVGVLERYKNVEGLAAAWRLVAARCPRRELHLVGTGTQAEVAEALARDGASGTARLEPPELAAAIDAARALAAAVGLGGAAAGRDRGLPARARRDRDAGRRDPRHRRGRGQRPPRRARRRGGARRARSSAILTDHELAVRLGGGGRGERGRRWVSTPEEYADRVRALVDAALARRPSEPEAALLMVARTRYALPLPPGTERKFAALRERFDLRVLATAADGRAHDDGVFQLVGRRRPLDGPLFYAARCRSRIAAARASRPARR